MRINSGLNASSAKTDKQIHICILFVIKYIIEIPTEDVKNGKYNI